MPANHLQFNDGSTLATEQTVNTAAPLPVSIIDNETANVGIGGGNTNYTNASGDFTVAFADTDSLTLSNLSFTPTVVNVASVERIDTAGVRTNIPLTTVVMTDNGNGTFTLDLAGRPTAFVTTDVYIVWLIGPDKSRDADLDADKVILQNPPSEQYTAPEAYTTLTPDSTSYDEGAVIDVRGYNTLNYMFVKTASGAIDGSTPDGSHLKVIFLLTADGVADYQENFEAVPSTGVTVVSPKVYSYVLGATIGVLSIDTKGMPFMRIDAAKATDAGTDAGFTGFIQKARN